MGKWKHEMLKEMNAIMMSLTTIINPVPTIVIGSQGNRLKPPLEIYKRSQVIDFYSICHSRKYFLVFIRNI